MPLFRLSKLPESPATATSVAAVGNSGLHCGLDHRHHYAHKISALLYNLTPFGNKGVKESAISALGASTAGQAYHEISTHAPLPVMLSLSSHRVPDPCHLPQLDSCTFVTDDCSDPAHQSGTQELIAHVERLMICLASFHDNITQTPPPPPPPPPAGAPWELGRRLYEKLGQPYRNFLKPVIFVLLIARTAAVLSESRAVQQDRQADASVLQVYQVWAYWVWNAGRDMDTQPNPGTIPQNTSSKREMPGEPWRGLWPCRDQGVIPMDFVGVVQPCLAYMLHQVDNGKCQTLSCQLGPADSPSDQPVRIIHTSIELIAKLLICKELTYVAICEQCLATKTQGSVIIEN